MRVRYDCVPAEPNSPLWRGEGFVLAEEAFRFESPSGVRFHYSMGDGITVELPSPHLKSECKLFLWGSVFGAVSWLNGFFPLHASAVDFGAAAVAFTGESGAGKSTLAAALARAGLPHVSDDTLPLYGSNGRIWAVPDRKPLKLWRASLDLLGMDGGEPIEVVPGKSYAAAPVSALQKLPLRHLILLADGEDVRLTPLQGAAALSVIAEAMYRPSIPAGLQRHGHHGEWLLKLGAALRVWTLARPRNCSSPESFTAQCRQIQRLIHLADD